VISLLVQIQLQVQSIYPLDFKAAAMGATAGVNLLEGADELVHSAEQSLLPLAGPYKTIRERLKSNNGLSMTMCSV